MKKYVILTVLCILSIGHAMAQEMLLRTESLADIHLQFELPAAAWSEAQIKKTKTASTIYTYTRKLGEGKKAAQASLSVLVEHIKPSTSIKEYSMKGLVFFKKQPGFQIKKTFIDSDGRFSLPYTIGYDAEYLDGNGQKHHLYILHTIEFNHGAQLLIDFPYEQFAPYEEEQDALLKSLRYQR